MKIESEFLRYLIHHQWIIGGFSFILIIGVVLYTFGNWSLGDDIAILAILSSMYIMMYNGHRTDYRFKKLIEDNDKNTLDRIIGPERRKELIIFAEDIEVLYAKSHSEQIPLEIIVKKLNKNENINNDYLEDFVEFMRYSTKKVSTHNLSSPIKLLIYNKFIALEKKIKTPMSENSPEIKNEIVTLAIEIYTQVLKELDPNLKKDYSGK